VVNVFGIDNDWVDKRFVDSGFCGVSFDEDEPRQKNMRTDYRK
jgi:hypothetical protein